MIQRFRRPDGTSHDIDHGPGPSGKLSMPGRPAHIGGALIGQMEAPAWPLLAVTPNAKKRSPQAAYRERHPERVKASQEAWRRKRKAVA